MNTENTLLHFCLCAINNDIPPESFVADTDLSELYKQSCMHKVTALVCYALEKVITPPQCFSEAKVKAIRKDMLLDAELDRALRFMESKGIYYMPLKGAVLKELYPRIGMRQMSDVDIYYDSRYREVIRQYMLENSYTCTTQSAGQDDYKREPVYNFEFHQLLFSQPESEVLFEYYKDVKERLIRKDETSVEYSMSKEDFYIYLIAHEYKHYSAFGTGIRSLLDVIIFLRHYEATLDWGYIRSELEKISLSEFEEKQRTVCKKLSHADWQESLSDDEQEFLSYFLSGSVYGDYSTGVVNRLTGQIGGKDRQVTAGMKARYILGRIFPPMEFYRTRYPFFYRYKVLIPLCVIYRVFLALFRRNDFVKSELEILNKK